MTDLCIRVVRAGDAADRMSGQDTLIIEYVHERQLPRQDEALHNIRKIASLVKPIMRARGWRVGTLAEFYPDERNLLGMP